MMEEGEGLVFRRNREWLEHLGFTSIKNKTPLSLADEKLGMNTKNKFIKISFQ